MWHWSSGTYPPYRAIFPVGNQLKIVNRLFIDYVVCIQPGESPKHQVKTAGEKSTAPATVVSAIPAGSAEAQLKYENDRLKLALAQR
jgi:hypothetical protein